MNPTEYLLKVVIGCSVFYVIFLLVATGAL